MAAPDTLQACLPDLAPAILAPLGISESQQLLAAIKTAGKLQEREYDEAFEKALEHIPSLLRGTIRKIIAG